MDLRETFEVDGNFAKSDNSYLAEDSLAAQVHWSRRLGNVGQALAAAGERPGRLTRGPNHDHILLYGSLCRELPAHRQLELDRSLRFVGVRVVSGILYDLGDYPALVAGSGTVRAELYRIDDVSVLSRIDEFEEYDETRSNNSPYRRTKVAVPRYSSPLAVWLFRPRAIDAWIYLYNRPVDGRPRVDCSSWVEYLARRAAIGAGENASGRRRD